MRSNKRIWLVLAGLVIAVVAWRIHARAAERNDAVVSDDGELDALLVDRPWIDHLPRGERDQFNVFFVLSEQPVGVFQKASAWQGQYEVFQYTADGKRKLTVEYPHTGDRETVRATATRCNERGMDFCLELSGASRGVKRYYSRKDWGAHEVTAAMRMVDAIAHTEHD